ncbi:MAG TPA: thermonuclease family protein [Candidatus Krumholzibacteria bacterium]|nr:thermonuclease family protein [Candidatus Krumholzibacteria bacterium]
MLRLNRVFIGLCLAASLCAAGTTGNARSPRPSYPGAVVINMHDVIFDDGDTFIVGHTAIRVLGIDTPEISHPSVGIMEDQPFGRAAADSTRAWMTRARVVEVAYDGRDVYRRRLGHVFIDGRLLAVKLLACGLAYENVRHFGDNGFPDLADQIMRAADAGPKPAFEPPYLWRKQHQHHTDSKK